MLMRQRKFIFFSGRSFRLLSFLFIFPFPLIASNSLKCDWCKNAIGAGKSYYRIKNKNYCSRSCADKRLEQSLPECSVCAKRIKGSYLTSNDKIFCSQKCYESTLPECTVCGKRSAAGALAADNSFFACPDCLRKPRCFSCQIPTGGRKLHDGRVICPTCSKTAVYNENTARKHFQSVRNDLKYKLGLGTSHPIQFYLIDQETLHKKSRNQSDVVTEQGLFEYLAELEKVVTRNLLGRKVSEKEEKTSELFNIYVLNGLPRERMEYVMAHELGHDWLVTHFPGIRDMQVKEGFAEYVGWLYNKLHNRDYLNKRIEANTDPVYGQGFRMIKDIADKKGFDGLKQFLNSKRESR